MTLGCTSNDLDLGSVIETDSNQIAKSNIFAKANPVNIDTKTFGKWQPSTKEGIVEWIYEVKENASSLNFGFSEFILPPSAELFICDEKNKNCQHFLPRKSEWHHLEMWTPILKGGTAKFTLRLNESEVDLLKMRIATINMGFEREERDGASQGCLIDVLCTDDFPQIEDWEREIRSVGLISIEGTRLCTGVLLNNVRQDFTPYFLTARHCGINATNAESVVVHWNYENSTCRFGEESNEMEGDGDLSIFNSGATFLADLQRSDFTLLRLNEEVVEEARAYFAGWSAVADAPVDVTTIHHANTEEKRITFGKGETSITRHFGQDVNTDLDHIRISSWDISSTSGGSSGGPLFDANHRVVGQLHGGLAACGNDESDWFGRLHTSWVGDSVPERQLKHWLDPDQSGLLELNGIWDELEPLSLQISIQETAEIICAGDSTARIQINIGNGSGPFRYSIDGGENFQFQNTFENLGAGFYSILVIDSDENTSAIVPFFINEPDELVLNFNQVYNQISLNVSGGTAPFLYSLNGEITFDSTFTNVAQGLNSFTVIDSKGCNTEVTIEVQFNEFESQLQVVEDPRCTESEDGVIVIQHSGTIGPYFYRLNNGPIRETNTFDSLAAGVYIGWVMDSLGNTVTTNPITLRGPSPLEANIFQQEENIIVDVDGGTAPYLYSYDGGVFIKENQFLSSENFEIIIVQDANGCMLEIENIFTSAKHVNRQSNEILYPNPTDGLIWLQGAQNIQSYIIINTNGQVVKEGSYEQGLSIEKMIDVSFLPSGMYVIQAKFRDGISKSMKFSILQK